MDRGSGVKSVVFACWFCQLAGAQAPEALRVGAPIGRALRPQEAHRYRIHLEAGQLLHLTARQSDADIALRLSRPDGGESADRTYRTGRRASRPSRFAPRTGDYSVSVTGAGPWPEGSRYELRVETAREAGAVDEELLDRP